MGLFGQRNGDNRENINIALGKLAKIQRDTIREGEEYHRRESIVRAEQVANLKRISGRK